MLQAQLNSLRDFILTHNSYFDEGISQAWQDEYTGVINDGSDEVFPCDDKGNYFYLRLSKNISLKYDNQLQVTECNKPLVISTDIILVAFMRDADEDLLLTNLINTIQQYKYQGREPNTITGAINKSELVIAQELEKIKKEDIEGALRRFDPTYSLVSVKFTYTVPFVFQKLSCITKPCKTC